ncbi:hypothetical protein J6590_096653 [Homalodisca vitripennis]|nr:hypothetical protein J6590_096653 [Homalodisca vitripennis]
MARVGGVVGAYRPHHHTIILTQRIHFWLVYTFSLNPHWLGTAKTDCHLNLDILKNIQKRHTTNRKCRNSGKHGRVRHPLPALIGDASSKLAFPSSEGT